MLFMCNALTVPTRSIQFLVEQDWVLSFEPGQAHLADLFCFTPAPLKKLVVCFRPRFAVVL